MHYRNNTSTAGGGHSSNNSSAYQYNPYTAVNGGVNNSAPTGAGMSTRNALFGSRGGGGQFTRGAVGGTTTSSFSEQTQRHYEEENNQQINVLGDKISMLKDVALSIGDEVESQNSLLGGMDTDMNNVRNLMGSTLRQLGKMLESGGSKHMCYLIVFIVGLFLVLYLLLSWR